MRTHRDCDRSIDVVLCAAVVHSDVFGILYVISMFKSYDRSMLVEVDPKSAIVDTCLNLTSSTAVLLPCAAAAAVFARPCRRCTAVSDA